MILAQTPEDYANKDYDDLWQDSGCYEGGILINASSIAESDYIDKDLVVRFNYCPICGEKIKRMKYKKCLRRMSERQWLEDECAWTCKQKCPYENLTIKSK